MRSRPVLALFVLTMFVSAFLLFCVQPIIAKMILPLLGGSPAVWGTCMVFFQSALLAGYAYAHGTSAWLDPRRQALVQGGLVLLPLLVLPFGIPPGTAGTIAADANPSLWLLGLLVATVGLPFFVLSTSAPVLQRWFARTSHEAASDPYFLYAASNLGSMLALLAYPIVIEPGLGLSRQSDAWSAGYGLLVVLTLCCVVVVRRQSPMRVDEDSEDALYRRPAHPGARQLLSWTFLAFVPSSLMLGLTTFLTTDIAAMPLLWVIPLALYLLTFILTFARRPPLPHRLMVRAFPMAAVLLALALSLSFTTQVILLPVHLAAFFLAAMVCHGELVRRRPGHEQLTAFYLTMAAGGVLGGLFNALLAPVVFNSVFEYPLALVLACLALPATGRDDEKLWPRLDDWILPVALGVSLASLIRFLQPRLEFEVFDAAVKLLLGGAAFLCYVFKDRRLRFALGIAAILIAGGSYTADQGALLYQHRNYFGVLRVTYSAAEGFIRLIHGHTLHGLRSLDPTRTHEPLSYFHRAGPIGQVFDAERTALTGARVAVVGLGAGSLASYSEPGQRWVFYEIDPAVVEVARDPRYFRFLQDASADSIEVVLGDARLQLAEAPERSFKLIVLDAFSSDAIPTHLLTREALDLYQSRLADGGILALHISNNFLDLVPVVGALAADAGLKCLVRRDLGLSPTDVRDGKSPSIWAVLAARPEDLESLSRDSRWKPPPFNPAEPPWTDDLSDIMRHLVFLGR